MRAFEHVDRVELEQAQPLRRARGSARVLGGGARPRAREALRAERDAAGNGQR